MSVRVDVRSVAQMNSRARRFMGEAAQRGGATVRGMGAEAKPGSSQSVTGDLFDFDLTSTSSSSATGGSAHTTINVGDQGGSSSPSPTMIAGLGLLGMLTLGGLAMWGLRK